MSGSFIGRTLTSADKDILEIANGMLDRLNILYPGEGSFPHVALQRDETDPIVDHSPAEQS